MASPEPLRKTSSPSSTLLQDLLREKKAQTQRVDKTYNMSRADDRGVQSSPIASTSTRDRQSSHPRRGSGGGNRTVTIPKEMGLKEMEAHLSKINKQNFDLKLDVFHCRQRNEVLEAKVEKMEALEADNAELQSINEDLLLELEKRDLAVQEAVGLICELDARIEEMGAADRYFERLQGLATIPASPPTSSGPEDSSTAPQTSRQISLSGEHPQDLEAPLSRAEAISPSPTDPSQRIPSILREHKKSTNVLRSLYSSESLFSGDEDEDGADAHTLNSPRLSILSESGFSEIYGDPKDHDRISPRQTNGIDIPETSPDRVTSPSDLQRGARLQKWIQERHRPPTPTRTSAKPAGNDHFSSIGEILERVPSTTKGHQPTETTPPERKGRQGRSPEKLERKETRQHQRRPSSPAFGGPMFGGAMLPPTPGTMSTVTIAGNSSTPSIVTEKSLLDGTVFPAGSHTALISHGRPGSSDSNLAHYPSTALTFDEFSDDDPESPARNRSPKATRVLEANAPVRPSLTSSATATVFSGEGYASRQPSRNLSYPSPTGRARRASERLSPTSEKSYITVGDRSSSKVQTDRRNGSSAASTPTKRNVLESRARSPPADQISSMQDPANPNTQPEGDFKLGRSASLRSKIAKMSMSPSQSTHQSVASRLFRRSNSQSVQAPPSNQISSSSRPPIARNNSSSQHARLPRPSSLHGSNPIYGQRPTPTHASNTVRQHASQQTPNPVHPYELSSILPDGMLTDTVSSSSSRYSRHDRERR